MTPPFLTAKVAQDSRESVPMRPYFHPPKARERTKYLFCWYLAAQLYRSIPTCGRRCAWLRGAASSAHSGRRQYAVNDARVGSHYWVAQGCCLGYHGGTEYEGILRTVSLCRPNTRDASLIPMLLTINTLPTREYTPTMCMPVKGGGKTCHWGGVKVYHLG